MELAPMSASSYSRVLNKNRLRTHSSTTSPAVAVTTTHHGRIRLWACDARTVPSVPARTGVSRSLLMLTQSFSFDAAERVPVNREQGGADQRAAGAGYGAHRPMTIRYRP